MILEISQRQYIKHHGLRVVALRMGNKTAIFDKKRASQRTKKLTKSLIEKNIINS